MTRLGAARGVGVLVRSTVNGVRAMRRSSRLLIDDDGNGYDALGDRTSGLPDGSTCMDHNPSDAVTSRNYASKYM